MLPSFCVWCKYIGPGIGGLLADRPDLLRFQSYVSHVSLFLCPSEVCVGRLLCLCVTLRLQEIKSNNNLQLLLHCVLEHPLKILPENTWHLGPPVSPLESENKLPLAEQSSAWGSHSPE